MPTEIDNGRRGMGVGKGCQTLYGTLTAFQRVLPVVRGGYKERKISGVRCIRRIRAQHAELLLDHRARGNCHIGHDIARRFAVVVLHVDPRDEARFPAFDFCKQGERDFVRAVCEKDLLFGNAVFLEK